MNKPVAVLISDIHFTVPTLERASMALTTALKKAKSLNVPLVIAGDLLDSKAIIRAECANRIIDIISRHGMGSTIYLLVGNHDLLSEKSEDHSLHFLNFYAHVISEPLYSEKLKAYLIPYQSDLEKLNAYLCSISGRRPLIMHQGVQGANMGHYIQDKTSLPADEYKDFRVISGHYHRAQDVKCGRPQKGAVGLFSYIGNPYTLNFGEADHGPKGYAILMDDGLLERVELDLPRHRIIEWNQDEVQWPASFSYTHGDFLWFKIYGSRDKLNKFDKKHFIETRTYGAAQVKIDFYYTDAVHEVSQNESLSDMQIIDKLIDSKINKVEDRDSLKTQVKELLSETETSIG